ncbi:hypothetical protein Leryth_023360 [Lithospermum erythrorhizon]|nr:hypothetical protein Leryth_023360 [Lithospermum erythrorhizon]
MPMWEEMLWSQGCLHSKELASEIVRYPDRVTPCRFWKWIDDHVPPLVRHAMDMNMKKLEEKAKLLGVPLVVCLAAIFFPCLWVDIVRNVSVVVILVCMKL